MPTDTLITITGNLTADPEQHQTTSGIPLTSFTIAVTARRYDRDTDQWVAADTVFWRCVAWNSQARPVAAALRRGMRVIAQGRPRPRTLRTREGLTYPVIELDIIEVGPTLRYTHLGGHTDIEADPDIDGTARAAEPDTYVDGDVDGDVDGAAARVQSEP